MNIISPSHDFDQQLADLLLGRQVGIKPSRIDEPHFSMEVEDIDVDNFVTLVGREVFFHDEFDPMKTYGELRRIAMIDIDRIDVY